MLLCCVFVGCGNIGVSCGDDAVEVAFPLVKSCYWVANWVFTVVCDFWFSLVNESPQGLGNKAN